MLGFIQRNLTLNDRKIILSTHFFNDRQASLPLACKFNIDDPECFKSRKSFELWFPINLLCLILLTLDKHSDFNTKDTESEFSQKNRTKTEKKPPLFSLYQLSQDVAHILRERIMGKKASN